MGHGTLEDVSCDLATNPIRRLLKPSHQFSTSNSLISPHSQNASINDCVVPALLWLSLLLQIDLLLLVWIMLKKKSFLGLALRVHRSKGWDFHLETLDVMNITCRLGSLLKRALIKDKFENVE